MTSTDLVPEIETEYVTLASQAVRASGGDAALDDLGWWELLPDLHDLTSRTAIFAMFRALGRELGASTAIGGLLAQPYLDRTAIMPGAVIATVPRTSARAGTTHVLIGTPGDRQLLIDRPGHGAAIVGLDRVELRPIDLPGRMVLHEVTVDWSRTASAIGEDVARAAWERSWFLGRVGLALEMVGAAEAAVDLAVGYAGMREQFGQPIGRFQAVRHLLAWARTDFIAASSVARHAVRLDRAAPSHYDELVKAIAGRNGRRACERSLQVLGGIGFTAEHDHHHFHSRVLALDALLGTSSDLTRGLGARLRQEGVDPGLTSALIAAT